MYNLDRLFITEITVEHMIRPLGIDCASPRFGWKLASDAENVKQTMYQLVISSDKGIAADTGRVESDQSIEVTVKGLSTDPMTEYRVDLTVWDNKGHEACSCTGFETGRMGVPFAGGWIWPVQEPTPSSMEGVREGDTIAQDAVPRDAEGNRTFEEFRPAQFVRIPFETDRPVRRGRVYATAHGLYRLEVNDVCPDERWLAPENTAYGKLLN